GTRSLRRAPALSARSSDGTRGRRERRFRERRFPLGEPSCAALLVSRDGAPAVGRRDRGVLRGVPVVALFDHETIISEGDGGDAGKRRITPVDSAGDRPPRNGGTIAFSDGLGE